MLCDFGCGREAIKTFKSGKSCCSNNTSSCPAMKEKNSTLVSNKRKILGNNYWPNGHPKGSSGGTSLKGKTYKDIYGESIATQRREHLSKLATGKDNFSKLTDEQKQLHSERARQNILRRYESGWMPKAGRCKKIKYISPVAGEVSLDRTWELKVAQYFDSMGFTWNRNTKRFQYINLKGAVSYYTPDFYVEEFGSYVEVKGYETELDRCKWSQFKEKLIVWKKEQISNLVEGGPDGKAADC